jgi:hypothetical protein
LFRTTANFKLLLHLKKDIFWVVALCSLAMITTLMMEAASTSETSVNFYQTTWRFNPEDSHLHNHHHDKLKSYITKLYFCIVISSLESE